MPLAVRPSSATPNWRVSPLLKEIRTAVCKRNEILRIDYSYSVPLYVYIITRNINIRSIVVHSHGVIIYILEDIFLFVRIFC